MDRIYLDYNATSPLAPSVKRWLARGDLLWANPAGQHSSGKHARARIDEVTEFLLQTFHLSSTTHKVFFHSGATEGVNTWVLGQASQGKLLFAYSPIDHACVRLQRERLLQAGHEVLELPIDGNGDLKFDEARALLGKSTCPKKILNWTWVQNETGGVWPLEQAQKFKEATGCLVHVDAVQAPGKVSTWDKLLPTLDAYTFSGHKFGALKGIGWSFVSKAAPALPALILGGGQQAGQRSGTENTMGVWSVKLALEDLQTEFSPTQQRTLITDLRAHMDQLLKGKGKRMVSAAQELNLNTILFVLNRLPSDMALPLFDLAGLEVSSGAACSSGAAKPSPVLLGLGEQMLAKNGLRLSTSWVMDSTYQANLKARLSQVFEKIPGANP